MRIAEVTWQETGQIRLTVLGWKPGPVPGDEHLAAEHLAMVDDDGKVVAVVSFMSHGCPELPAVSAVYLWGMAVAPDSQGLGHGTELIAEVLVRAGRLGAQAVWADARAASVSFYERCGARAVGDPYVDEVTGRMDRRVIFDLRSAVGVSAGKQSVVLFGDSHLTERSSSGLTQLGPRLRHDGWSVMTIARGGLDTATAVREYPRLPSADWVVYSFGSNDSAPWNDVPLQVFDSSYRQLLARSPGRRAVVLGPPPVLESGPGALGRTNVRIGQYSDCAARIAAERGGAFVSLLDLLRPEADLVDDGLHLNQVGYQKVAHALVSVLRARA